MEVKMVASILNTSHNSAIYKSILFKFKQYE